jgi:hypothetical protein
MRRSCFRRTLSTPVSAMTPSEMRTWMTCRVGDRLPNRFLISYWPCTVRASSPVSGAPTQAGPPRQDCLTTQTREGECPREPKHLRESPEVTAREGARPAGWAVLRRSLPWRPNPHGNGPCQSYNRLQRIGCSPSGWELAWEQKRCHKCTAAASAKPSGRVWGPSVGQASRLPLRLQRSADYSRGRRDACPTLNPRGQCPRPARRPPAALATG